MSENNNALQNTINRTVVAYQQGVGKKSFASSAVTYGDLKEELLSAGFNLENTRVSEGITQIDLINSGAILPTNILNRGAVTNDLIIIMTPKENPKSGNDYTGYSYRELKSIIKGHYRTAKGRVFFGNYTHLSTPDMQRLLTEWDKKERDLAPKKEVAEVVQVNKKTLLSALESIISGAYVIQELFNAPVEEYPSEDDLQQMINELFR